MARHTWTSKCLILSTPLFCSSIYWKHELSSLGHSLVLICKSLIFQTVLKSLITNTLHCQGDCQVSILFFSASVVSVAGKSWSLLYQLHFTAVSTKSKKSSLATLLNSFATRTLTSLTDLSFVRLTRCLCSLFYGSARDPYSRQSHTSSEKCR